MHVNKVHICVFAGFLLLAFFSLRLVFVVDDPVGFSDLSPMYKLDQLFRPFDFPWDFKSNLGSPVFLTGNVLYNVPLILLSLVVGSVVVAHKILLVLLMAFAGFGFYLAFFYLFNSKSAGLVGSLVMLFCPFILARWMNGHNTILLAYVVLSYAFFVFLRVMRVGGRLNVFVCGMLAGLLVYVSPQVAYLFLLFMVLYVVFDVVSCRRLGLYRRFSVRFVQLGVVLGVVFVVSLPFFYLLLMVNLPVYAVRAEEVLVSVLSPQIMGAVFSHGLLSVFACVSLLFLCWKSGFRRLCGGWVNGSAGSASSVFVCVSFWQVVFFAILGFLSVVVVVFASFSFFVPVYQWFFTNVPGFGMFREADKFLLFSGLSLAFFLALVADGFKRFVVRRVAFGFWRGLPVFLVSVVVLSSSLPYLSGDMGGSVRTVSVPEAYVELDGWLRAQGGCFRVAFFPPAVWATVYNWSSEWFLDPVVSLQAQPTVEIKSEMDLTASASFARWVYTELYSRRVSEWGKFLAVLGVKYLVVRLDADVLGGRSDLSAFSLANTVAALSVVRDFQLEKNFTSVLVYRNLVPLPLVFEADGFSLLVGDRRVLWSLANADFGQYSGVFLDDNLGFFSDLIKRARCVVLQGDCFWSLVVASFGSDCVVQPWVYAPVSVRPWGRWVRGDLVWWFWGGVLNVAPDGFIYVEGAADITIPLGVDVAGSYRVLVQVYDGQLPVASSGLRFVSEGVGSLDYVFRPSRVTEGSYRWVDLGFSYLDEQSALRLINLGGAAAVSKIAVLPEDAVAWAEDAVSELFGVSGSSVVHVLDDFSWNYNFSALSMSPVAGDGRLINLQRSDSASSFYVFRGGAYFLRGRFLVSGVGASVRVIVDGSVVDVGLSDSGGGLVDVDFGSFYLGVGWHNITVQGLGGGACLDVVFLCDGSADVFGSCFSGISGLVGSDVEVLCGSEYRVHLDGGALVFLEGGGDYWVLHGSSGQCARRASVFNYGSLFFVDDGAEGDYVLRYVGLDYLRQGVLLSLVGLGLLVVVLWFLGRRLVFKVVCC